MRRKFKGYYYSTTLVETSARNNVSEVKYYQWKIMNKEGDVLQTSKEPIEGKDAAERDAEDHINEYYY